MAPEPLDVVIYGSSGNAVGMRDMITHGFGSAAFRVVAYIDDFRGDCGDKIDDAPIVLFETWRAHFRALPCLIGVGAPAARRMLADRVAGAGGRFCSAYRIMGAISPKITVGEGTVLGYPAYIGPFTAIGRHVHVMTMVTIGHDVTIGDCVTIASSANIAGHVVVEDDVFIGAGSVVVNGAPGKPLRIGRGAAVHAGAVVTKSVPPGARVAGNPAADLRTLVRRRRQES